MDRVKEHFEGEAQEFDSLILRLIPGYEEMVKALVLAIPDPRTAPLHVVDLGCGTGTVAKRIAPPKLPMVMIWTNMPDDLS